MEFYCQKCRSKYSTKDISIQQKSFLTYICPKCDVYYYFSPVKMCAMALSYALILIIFWSIYFFFTKIFNLHINLTLLLFLLCIISFITIKVLLYKNSNLIASEKNSKIVSVFKAGLSSGLFAYVVLEFTLGMWYIIKYIDNNLLLSVFIVIAPCLPILLLGIFLSFIYKLIWQLNKKLKKSCMHNKRK